jgi:pSer/pThr/pTyr-binding forkhead associated (FHA) protein
VPETNNVKFVLEWEDAPGSVSSLPLPDGEVLIGRSSTCRLVLNDQKVSRQHAKIVVSGNTITIEDTGSRNGTYVNGEGVSRADLNGGDHIRLGDTIIRIISTTPAPGVTAVTPSAPEGEQTQVPGAADQTQVTPAVQTQAPAPSPEQTVVVAASSEGTIVVEPRTRDPSATLVLEPAAPPEPEPERVRGIVPDDILRKPVISEQELIDNGVEVKVAEFAALGGGIGSFVWVDVLRNSGVPTSEILVASNDEKPYGRYRRLVQNSQIPDHERLRSNSDSCPDCIWGFPGYAVREIWRELWRGNIPLALKVAWQIFGEPTLAPTFTPRTEDVWRALDRESRRINWDSMLVLGRIRAIRKTEEGRILAVVSQSDQTTRRHLAVSARLVHLAPGYPSLQFLPDLAEFREKHGDRERVVNAYENHNHVYQYLRQNGGTVVLRGRGIVASRIIQRLYEERKHNPNIRVIHLHRSKLAKGHSYGLSKRGIADDFEFQPFNWPKSGWGGQTRVTLEKASPEERKRLLEIWGGTTTADRPDWKRIVKNGIKEGWYRPEYGVVDEVRPGEGGKVITRIRSASLAGTILELPADFIIDCTGLVAAPERSPMLADLLQTYNLPKNPLGRVHVSNDFEIEGMRHGEARMWTAGAITLGGPYAPVDSFLGLQYAALRASRHMLRFRPKKMRKLNGIYSFFQWLRWATGGTP